MILSGSVIRFAAFRKSVLYRCRLSMSSAEKSIWAMLFSCARLYWCTNEILKMRCAEFLSWDKAESRRLADARQGFLTQYHGKKTSRYLQEIVGTSILYHTIPENAIAAEALPEQAVQHIGADASCIMCPRTHDLTHHMKFLWNASFSACIQRNNII